MPTTISEEVQAKFTADTTNLVDGANRAIKKAKEVKAAYSERMNNVRGTILDPSSLIERGIGKLTSSMKLSAVTAGVVSAGFQVASSAIADWRASAAAAKQDTDALSESMRKLSNSNRITSASEGAPALIGRLPGLRDAQTALREKEAELNPPSAHIPFTNIPIKSNAQIALDARYASNYGVNADEHLDTDRLDVQQRQRDLAKEEGKIRGQITNALQTQDRLAEMRLTSDSESIRIEELRLQRERELTELKAAGLGEDKAGIRAVESRYGREIAALEKVRTLKGQQYEMELSLVALRTSSLNGQQQQYVTDQAHLRSIRDESRIRASSMTVEETRANALKELGLSSSIRLAQRAQIAKTPTQIAREMYRTQRQATRNAQLDARIAATDGLINTRRDIGGKLIGGADIVTGEQRLVSQDYAQRNSGLRSGSLNDRPRSIAALEDRGHDTDTAKGRGALDAARATVDALDTSNAYLKNISEYITNIGLN